MNRPYPNKMTITTQTTMNDELWIDLLLVAGDLNNNNGKVVFCFPAMPHFQERNQLHLIRKALRVLDFKVTKVLNVFNGDHKETAVMIQTDVPTSLMKEKHTLYNDYVGTFKGIVDVNSGSEDSEDSEDPPIAGMD
jgi:hypothetical protein